MIDPTAEADLLREKWSDLERVIGCIDFDLDDDLQRAVLFGRLVRETKKTIQAWLAGLPDEDQWWMDDTLEKFHRVLGVRFADEETPQ